MLLVWIRLLETYSLQAFHSIGAVLKKHGQFELINPSATQEQSSRCPQSKRLLWLDDIICDCEFTLWVRRRYLLELLASQRTEVLRNIAGW